jgi:chitinase
MQINRIVVKIICIVIFFSFLLKINAQIPNPALIGYFHNWNSRETPYIRMDQIDPRYNIIIISFAVPKQGSFYNMEFIPATVNREIFKAQIQTLQMQGKKIIISIGGANHPVKINQASERDIFVSSITSIINVYNFEGLDLDLEENSLSITGGTIDSPIDKPVIYLIEGIKQIMANYRRKNNRKLILTLAPETAHVQGGMSSYNNAWGAYLPVIQALRDSIDILHVQLYNSGPMYGIDRKVYAQGTADFIVSQTEAVIRGFQTAGGFFVGLPENKIAVGLPACPNIGGYTQPEIVRSAINYLRGAGPKPGRYTLVNQAGYPHLRGMMTWSINLDKFSSCADVYEFADNYKTIFADEPAGLIPNNSVNKFSVYPNPVNKILYIYNAKNENPFDIQLFGLKGNLILEKKLYGTSESIDISDLPNGIYFLKLGDKFEKILIRNNIEK